MDRLRQAIGNMQAEAGRRLEGRRVPTGRAIRAASPDRARSPSRSSSRRALILLLDARRRLNQLRETERRLTGRQRGARPRGRAEDRGLRENAARLGAFFENAAVGCAELGLDQRYIRVNARLCQLTGYSAEELIGMARPADPSRRPAARRRPAGPLSERRDGPVSARGAVHPQGRPGDLGADHRGPGPRRRGRAGLFAGRHRGHQRAQAGGNGAGGQ